MARSGTTGDNSSKPDRSKPDRRIVVELEELRTRLEEAEQTLSAIRGGEVDALVVYGPRGEQVYTLQGAETPYRVLVEQMQEGALTLAADGTILYANRRFAEIVGVPLEQAVGTPLSRFVSAGDVAALDAMLKDAGRRAMRHDFVLHRADGSTREVQLSASALPDDEASRLCMVVTDLTEHKHNAKLLAERTAELEKSGHALRLAERFASLGTLATGLGHDMSNMLLPIRMRLDALEADLGTIDRAENVTAVRGCVEHLQRLSSGLRLLALDPELAASDGGVDINEWWAGIEPVLRTGLPRAVDLETDFAPGLPRVAISRHGLAQAVHNLIQNAGDAMRDQPDGRVRLWARLEGEGRVCIGVSDNGPGMTPEVLQRCLEPFFTTKTRRFSTGLGLALVHANMQRAGGRIDIESAPGRGTTFMLTLDVADEKSRTPDLGPESRPLAVVSLDAPQMRAYISAVLTSMGVAVEAADAPDAVNAQLWVARAREDSVAAAQRFVETDASRRVLLLGDVDAGAGLPEQVAVLSGKATPAQVREALRGLLSPAAPHHAEPPHAEPRQG